MCFFFSNQYSPELREVTIQEIKNFEKEIIGAFISMTGNSFSLSIHSKINLIFIRVGWYLIS